MTSTGDRNSLLGKLKMKLAMDFDFKGNHGMLTHEEVRFMDKGGLHGYTFELTEKQFQALKVKCSKALADQEAAISEFKGTQNLASDPDYKK